MKKEHRKITQLCFTAATWERFVTAHHNLLSFPPPKPQQLSPVFSSSAFLPEKGDPTCDIEVPPHSPLQPLFEQAQGGVQIIRCPDSCSCPLHWLLKISQELCWGQGIVLQVLLYAARDKNPKSEMGRGRDAAVAHIRHGMS